VKRAWLLNAKGGLQGRQRSTHNVAWNIMCSSTCARLLLLCISYCQFSKSRWLFKL